MDVKSCSESSLVASVYSITGGVDGTGFTKGEEVDGLISMKGSRITATIGHKTITTTAKQNRMIYFCVHLYYVDNSVSIYMLSRQFSYCFIIHNFSSLFATYVHFAHKFLWLTKTALGLLKRASPSKIEAFGIIATTTSDIRLRPCTCRSWGPENIQ